MFERDLPVDRWKCDASWTKVRFRHRVENVAKSRHGQPGLVEVLPHLRETQHWRADVGGQHIKCNKLADGKAAADNQPSAKVQYQDDRHFVDQLHGLTCE